MRTLLLCLVAVLLVMIALMIYRVIKGPTVFDRMNGLGVIGADVIILLVYFGFLDGRPDMYIDIAIAYAILGFIGNITLGKYLDKRGK